MTHAFPTRRSDDLKNASAHVDKIGRVTQMRAFSASLQAARGSPLALSQLLSQSCHMRASGALAGLGAPRSRACRTHHQRGNPEMKFRQTLTASVALLPVARSEERRVG